MVNCAVRLCLGGMGRPFALHLAPALRCAGIPGSQTGCLHEHAMCALFVGMGLRVHTASMKTNSGGAADIFWVINNKGAKVSVRVH